MDLRMISAPYEVRYKYVQTMIPSPTEDLVEAIYQTFDEFQSSLTEKESLHPSEECHRQKWFATDCKIFDVINSYHVFCKLCQKHFYSRSVPTDINSFFENHLNTEYHREIRDSMFPRSKEMISWETVWVTGRCNLCEMPGLYAIVKDMKYNFEKLIEQHLCFGNHNIQINNLEFCRKISLLKKFCKLSIFRDKFIKTLNDGSACLLCCSKILWSGECVRIHLGSPKHMARFFRLILSRHNLFPKDLLNGFNLEMVTRWIYNCVFKCPDNLRKDYEVNRIECFLASSAHLSLNYHMGVGYYCPKVIEKLLDYQPSDFIRNNICILCNLPIVDVSYLDNGHFRSEYHKSRLANFSAKSFVNKDQYEAFRVNRNNRLQYHILAIENYKQLKDGTHLHSLKVGLNNAEKTSVIKTFFQKLELVKGPPPTVVKENHMCEVCDIAIPASLVDNHATEFKHLYYLKRWQELEKYAADSRFFDPFQKVRMLYICMLCGICAEYIQFFQHLKDVFHAQRFNWYCTLDNKIPISSAVEVRPDLSVVCYLCDRILLREQNVKDFKIKLKTIRDHWPCLLVNEKKGETKEVLNARENIEGTCPCCGNSQRAHKKDCSTNTLNWKGVENSINGIVDTCEGAIFESVLAKTKSTINEMEGAMVVDRKQLRKAACECKKSRGQCKCGDLNGDLTEVGDTKGKSNEIEMQDLKNRITDDKKKSKEKEQQVLVISGLPVNLSATQKSEMLLSIFRKYGNIHDIHFKENLTEVIFADQSVAEKVPSTVEIFPNSNPPVVVTVKLKKVTELENKESGNANPQSRVSVPSKSTFTPMPSDLLELMRQPTKLLEFISSSTEAATAAAASSKELQREEMVCATINNAVRDLFPQCRCYPFGSRLSGLMFSDSDLDVFLDCGGMYEGIERTSPVAERALIHSVAKLLKKSKGISHLIIIDRARVPIISFLHQRTGLLCDLSVKNALSIHNTILIKFLTSLDIQIKKIIMFFKYWVKHNGIHGPRYFSSYAITMMAIFYLQQLEPPMVPTVEKLQNAFIGRRLAIAGWDCSFSEKADGFVNKSSEFPLHVILQGLFDYFANFEFDKFAISPLDGKPLPREAFCSDGEAKLPMCYKKHILNFPQPIQKLVCKSIPICVFDPFDLSHVLTKNFSSAGLELFKHYCQLSAEALKEGALNVLKCDDIEVDPS